MSRRPATESVDPDLRRLAERLSADHQVPIDLGTVLARHGLRLATRPERRGRTVGGLLDATPGRGRTIVLYGHRPGTPLAPHERFTVAHELAHHILRESGAPEPATDQAYWAREEECNQFAAALLVPAAAVRYATRPPPATSGELFSRLRTIVERAYVSREVAARRVIPLLSGSSAWEASDLPDRDDVAALMRWCVEDEPIVGLRRAAHMRPSHALASLVGETFAWSVGLVGERSASGITWVIERRHRGVWIVGLRPDAQGQQTLPLP